MINVKRMGTTLSIILIRKLQLVISVGSLSLRKDIIQADGSAVASHFLSLSWLKVDMRGHQTQGLRLCIGPFTLGLFGVPHE